MSFTAGVYEQSSGGWRRVEWSKHQTATAAAQAARRYAKMSSSATGGALSWAAWYFDGTRVVEV